MRAEIRLGREAAAADSRGCVVKADLAERIEGLAEEMGAALAEGEYDRVVQLAEEQERLLEALMI